MTKFLKFIPIQLTLCLVLGILFGHYFEFNTNILFIISGSIVIFFSIVYYAANKMFQPSLLFAVFTFLFSFFIGVNANSIKKERNNNYFYGNQQEFSVDSSQTATFIIAKILKPTAYYNRYEAEMNQLNSEAVSGKILVNISKDSAFNGLTVDDRLLVNTLLSEIPLPKNPYGFNYKNYLKNHQIHHQIYIDKSQFLNLGKGDTSVKGLAAKVRKAINIALLKRGFKDDELAVINALLLGQRQEISSELMQSYVGAGAIHILAVSGLHVGIILLILSFLLKPLHYFKNGKIVASVSIVILLWMFAILAGLSASVVRAVTMFSAIAIGMYSNRITNVYNTLVISMFLLLLVNPFYLFEVGFQLSYLAVFAIVWIQPKIYGLWEPKPWVADKFWQLFTVSMSAQIGVLPLSLFYFHQFPGLFFISNLVIIPFLGIILIAGVMIMLLAVLDLLPQIMSDGYIFVIHQMNNFISWISSQSFFIIQNITFSLAMLVAFYMVIFFTLKWTEKKNFQRMVFALISIILLQAVFVFEKQKLHSASDFMVFNKSKESIIGKRLGNELLIDTSIDDVSKNEYLIRNYLVGTGVDSISFSTEIQNLQYFKNEAILLIDSLGIYNFNSVDPTIVILRQSPKINLDRLLNSIQPRLIIADGSNYKSYVSKWAESCRDNKTPFHNTMQNGAYILN